jgi:hypothetical protein
LGTKLERRADHGNEAWGTGWVLLTRGVLFRLSADKGRGNQKLYVTKGYFQSDIFAGPPSEELFAGDSEYQ